MIKVTIDNTSLENHHTVRLTPVNGEKVNPLSLVGAALWTDELAVCLAPRQKDLTCSGTDERIVYSSTPENFLNYWIHVNDIQLGQVIDFVDGIYSDYLAEYDPETGRFSLENLTTECVRFMISTDGNIDPTLFVTAPESSTAYQTTDITEGDGWETIVVHLGPTRLNSVAIDYKYTVGEMSNIETGFAGQLFDLEISTRSLLPSDGLRFKLDGVEYTIPKDGQVVHISFNLPNNPSRYPKSWKPQLEILNPEFLLNGSLPELTPITIQPEGFNRSINVKYGQIGDREKIRQSDATTGYVSFYEEQKVDRIYLSSGRNYYLQFDSSFAGAKLYVNSLYSLNPFIGVLDADGRIEFSMNGPVLGRGDMDMGFYLTDGDNPQAFFNISGIIGFSDRPWINSDTLGLAALGWTTSVSSGYGNLITISGIPASILEIEISNERWANAPNEVTAWHQPKRLTRANGNEAFTMVPDKPLYAYSSYAGTWLYYVNRIQILFVIDGVVTQRGMWQEYKLNVNAG